MNQWLQSLSTLEYAMLILAVPATLILVLQTLLLLLGLHQDSDGDLDGDADADMEVGWDADLDGDGIPDGIDLDGDGIPDDLEVEMDSDTDGGVIPDDGDGDGGSPGLFEGLKLFTLRGVIAFLAIFGWGSLWLLRMGMHPVLALFLGVAMGVWAMVMVALLLRVALRLQDDGTIQSKNALGLSGTVYLTVPAQRRGAGKVNLLVQEQLTEFSAVTDDPDPLPTGAEALVVGLSGKNTLVVTRK